MYSGRGIPLQVTFYAHFAEYLRSGISYQIHFNSSRFLTLKSTQTISTINLYYNPYKLHKHPPVSETINSPYTPHHNTACKHFTTDSGSFLVPFPYYLKKLQTFCGKFWKNVTFHTFYVRFQWARKKITVSGVCKFPYPNQTRQKLACGSSENSKTRRKFQIQKLQFFVLV